MQTNEVVMIFNIHDVIKIFGKIMCKRTLID